MEDTTNELSSYNRTSQNVVCGHRHPNLCIFKIQISRLLLRYSDLGILDVRAKNLPFNR